MPRIFEPYVRLEDRKAGVVWLQIPSKSMLMNAKLGQRLVDSCLNEAQRGEAVLAAAAGAPSIGIATVPAEPPPAAPTVVVVPVSGPATPAPAALPGWMGPASPPASPASAADQPAPEAPPAPGPAASAPN